MENLWDDNEAKSFQSDLALRVYTSNLLGRSDELVLHGGGNTSVKSNLNGEEILYVKGSGWDLVSIKEEGFAPVKLDVLKHMATLDTLSDTDMVSQQKAAMTDKSAPNPSVEAILHAIIPFKFVDHTHADAVVTLSNNKTGIANIEKVFPNFLIVPYVMPGFILAKTIYDMSKEINWETCEGIILHNHGIFTFDDDAKKSYDKMIEAVSLAEAFLEQHASYEIPALESKPFDTQKLQTLISNKKGFEVVCHVNQTPLALYFASLSKEAITRGVLTPEHIIRTKREPLVLNNESMEEAIEAYETNYKNYFEQHAKNEIMLNPSPNYAVIKDFGVMTFGKNEKEATILNDIITHTMNAVFKADKLGGYKSIHLADSFEMEYWELEQAKLKK
jgi:rhamnose utilization protein RhaD (predicted bifunctional aldolase and dehydrogenase)